MTARLMTTAAFDSLHSEGFYELNEHYFENHSVSDNDDHVSQITNEHCDLL